ncbi:MAG: PEP-CTERM sorting domain-containing protein [Desulfuromonadaceae bacterium]|nr:PEP-CTERM sorting domain-containing protein [Desulfuromonadaceae bacterium]
MIKKLMVGIFGVILSSSLALATPITGSTSIGAASATLSGGYTLLSATEITPNSPFISPGFGDYSVIAPFTFFSSTGLNLANILDYTWTSPVGTWTTSAYTIITQTATNLDLFLLGNFAPTGVLAGFDPSGASEHISLNQTGNAVSWGATLNSPALSPPAPVPEPGTMMLLGSGLFGLVVYSKRRKNQNNSCTA